MYPLDDLSGLRAFIQVVDKGSLSAAAAEMGLTLAAVSKRLAGLERRAGTQLIRRSTRHLSVTPEGQTLYEHAVLITEQIQAAEDALQKQKNRVSGTVSITAPHSFGRRILAPLTGSFHQSYPEVHVRMFLSDDLQDLVGHGYDLAIRYGELPDSGLVARPLMANKRILCASPDYLQRCGTPETINDLAQHSCIAMGMKSMTDWHFNGRSVRLSPVISCNDGEACHELALQGMGIVQKSVLDVAEDIRCGRLVQILKSTTTVSAPVNALYPRNRDMAPRVRAFLDFMSEYLKQSTAL